MAAVKSLVRERQCGVAIRPPAFAPIPANGSAGKKVCGFPRDEALGQCHWQDQDRYENPLRFPEESKLETFILRATPLNALAPAAGCRRRFWPRIHPFHSPVAPRSALLRFHCRRELATSHALNTEWQQSDDGRCGGERQEERRERGLLLRQTRLIKSTNLTL